VEGYLSVPETLFSSEGITLTSDGLFYDISNGFFRRIWTGVAHRHGFTPIQHISGVELKTWHSFSILLAPFGAVLVIGIMIFFGPGSASFLIPFAVGAIIALLLIILWFVVRTTRLVVYSDGNLFIAVNVRKDAAEEFMLKYQMLKR
jgi:hypothetical protein